MSRWEPDARGRLEEAAMALFQERGYDRTTVEDIAARAGLTERTFFRHFSDKREVLFAGSSAFQGLVLDAVARAPKSTAPVDAVVEAFAATSPWFESRRKYARKRSALIVAHAELYERELIKLASLGAAIAEPLRKRGLTGPAADLAAQAGVAVFRNGFERWVDEVSGHELAYHLQAALDELRSVTVGASAAASPTRAVKAQRRPVRAARRS